ncbi:type II toxin-antitoxin system RatA family toxin [Streptomyces sp. NPDC088116]|uniref:type II toxin-antitoxin system RatA family toxin n=1 Tax=Streptomyces sp. NPDC088116 TaxID=3365825 RepID=UPI003816C243
MRSIHLRVDVATADPAAAFETITEFTRFPDLAKDVHVVETTPGDPRHSDWEVNFRRGIMRWTEWETIDRERLRIEFDQTDGDFEEFRGSWQLTPVSGGVEVHFEVTYDFGIESLVGIMDPIAERVIKRVVCSVLAALFVDVTVREGGESLNDLEGPASQPNPQPVGGS